MPSLGLHAIIFLVNEAHSKSFFEAAAMMKQTYNFSARQLQVVRLLAHLRFRMFVSEKSISDASEGLKSLVEYIALLMPLTPTAYHHTSNKVKFFKRAFSDQPCATKPLKIINALQ